MGAPTIKRRLAKGESPFAKARGRHKKRKQSPQDSCLRAYCCEKPARISPAAPSGFSPAKAFTFNEEIM